MGISLAQFHEVFYAIWKLTKLIEDKRVDTIGVARSYDGTVYMVVNPDFWKALPIYDRTFILAHEMIHIVHQHIDRIKNLEFPNLGNLAADIVVNEKLLRSYGFLKDKLLKDWNFMKKVQPVQESSAEPGKKEELGPIFESTFGFKHGGMLSMEEYYNLLLKDPNLKVNYVFDVHGLPQEVIDELFGKEGENVDQFNEAFSRRLKELAPPKQIKDFMQKSGKDNNKPSSGRSDQHSQFTLKDMLSTPPKLIKKPWQKAIEAKARGKFHSFPDSFDDVWYSKPRSLSLMDKEYLIPSEIEKINKAKIDIWIFMDVSGSCHALTQKFLDIARNIDYSTNRVRAFVFHTEVLEVNLKSNRLPHGGGTCFDIIEQKIQDLVSKGDQHPDMVYIVTDGDGNEVHPKHPRKWHWIIEPHGSNALNTRYVDSNSKTYSTGDYL